MAIGRAIPPETLVTSAINTSSLTPDMAGTLATAITMATGRIQSVIIAEATLILSRTPATTVAMGAMAMAL
jgi:hypothetical protein